MPLSSLNQWTLLYLLMREIILAEERVATISPPVATAMPRLGRDATVSCEAVEGQVGDEVPTFI